MDTDVVIVGGGPSGLVLGLFLAEYRVKVSTNRAIQKQSVEPRSVNTNRIRQSS